MNPTIELGFIVRKPVVADSTTMVKAAEGRPTATHRSPAWTSPLL